MALVPQSKNKSVMPFGDHEHRDLNRIIAVDPNKKPRRIQVEVEDSIHADFKVACAKKGVNMKEVITDLIKNWVNQNK